MHSRYLYDACKQPLREHRTLHVYALLLICVDVWSLFLRQHGLDRVRYACRATELYLLCLCYDRLSSQRWRTERGAEKESRKTERFANCTETLKRIYQNIVFRAVEWNGHHFIIYCLFVPTTQCKYLLEEKCVTFLLTLIRFGFRLCSIFSFHSNDSLSFAVQWHLKNMSNFDTFRHIHIECACISIHILWWMEIKCMCVQVNSLSVCAFMCDWIYVILISHTTSSK